MSILELFKKSNSTEKSFGLNFLTLATGTAVAQAIPIFLMPLLARLYTPSDFGIVAIYLAISTILGVVAAGRYEVAIILPHKNDEAINLVATSCLASFLVSATFYLIVLVAGNRLALVLGNPQMYAWLKFVPLAVLLTGLYNAIYYWANRNKEYRKIFAEKVWSSVAGSSSKLLFGFASLGPIGLVGGNIIGQAVGIFILWWKVLRKEKQLLSKIKWTNIKTMMREYKTYPLKSATGAFLNSISYQIEYVLFSMFFDLKSLGLYYFANRIVLIPKMFVSTSMWQIFLAESSGKSIEEVYRTVSSYQGKMLRISILPFYSSIFVISSLFTLIFGSQWAEAATFFYPIIIAAHMSLIVASFSLFVTVNKPGAEMVFNLLLLITKISTLVISFWLFRNIYYVVICLSVAQFATFFMLGSWNYTQLGKPIHHFFVFYFLGLFKIMPYIVFILLLHLIFNSFWVTLTGTTLLNLIYLTKGIKFETRKT